MWAIQQATCLLVHWDFYGCSCHWVKEQRRQHPSVSACLITSFDDFHYCTTYWTFPFISICSGKATSSRQVLSRVIVVLVVDNPFTGYPATHACYRWIISATSKKQQ
ncbi:hypothetical protein O0I10_003513 [Lichtheimia ornata]|uniref:Uncharacterized protein n=1 Tax=Lichtheimia ornata TaxID=688661 RepID=A0AAD7V8A5_9FUNG|nr:uncharacterized protein O0I10_003513 [Lichtheimia ornata]KAJ8660869.1 hypothetical protein O0I10_003513 [Lichtheimia ornata]